MKPTWFSMRVLGLCSPSLSFLGECECPRCRHPERYPKPEPLPPLHGPLELDDAVGAIHDDDCDTCRERRREADYPDWAWGPLHPMETYQSSASRKRSTP